MNYGRRKASKRQKEITSKGTMQGKRMGVRLFKAFLLLILVFIVKREQQAGPGMKVESWTSVFISWETFSRCSR